MNTDQSNTRPAWSGRQQGAVVTPPVAGHPSSQPERQASSQLTENSRPTRARKPSLKKQLAAATLVVAGVAGTVGLSGGVAEAAGSSYCNSSTCSLAAAPYTGYIYFQMPRYTPVRMLCWTSTQYWNGTAKWFKVSSIYGTGYMNANQVGNQSIVGRC